MKLLLLEDDTDMRTHVTGLLREAGHVIDICATGPDAIFMATSNDYAVLILDRMVPDVDGLRALKAIRAAGVQTPALFLTAVQSIADRVEGLEAGADDYLVKPFAASELLARVSALARRQPLNETITKLRVADVELDLLRRIVTRSDKRIELQQQEYKLLEYLMRHAGEIVTRTMLLENIWSFHFDPGTNIIESHISRLRAKIDRGLGVELIQTVRGAGYRMRSDD